MILAVSDDGEAARVASQLRARGVATAWLDTADFPSRVTVSAVMTGQGWIGEIVTAAATIDLAAVSAVLYRQSQPFTFPARLSASERQFAAAEARFGLGGLLASLQARWVPGTPRKVADAEYRAVQLASAARCGLLVPATALGNCPESIRGFAMAQPGGVLHKTLMDQVATSDGQHRSSDADSDGIGERVAVTMSQVQANLAHRKLFDACVVATRIGQHAVAVRRDDPATGHETRPGYELITTPDEVIRGCRRYLHAMSLQLAVFDFCVTPDGWYFLNAGPSAPWAWLEEQTGAPIAAMIASALLSDR